VYNGDIFKHIKLEIKSVINCSPAHFRVYELWGATPTYL